MITPALRRCRAEFLKDVHFEPGDEKLQFTAATEPYFEGQTAMIRGTAAMADGSYEERGIDSNHLYMRLASTEVFAISQDVGHKMMTGEYDAQGAYEDFNAQITDYVNPEAEEVIFTQETAYSNDFGVHGS